MAHDHAATTVADPVIDQIVRQIALIHNSAQAGPRSTHARAVAAQLRMLAVYQRQQRMDDQVRTGVKDLVRREGRNAVLYAVPDQETRRTEREKYGFRADDRVDHVPLNMAHAAREAALDELLEHGVTPAYERLAATLDKVAARVDRRSRGLVTIAQDDDYWAGYCAELFKQYQTAQWMALPFCLTARYFAWAAPACLAMEGGATVLLIFYLIDC
jgi:hypothetical protein